LETKDRIVGEATTLFFAYGIRNVSMDDIAKHIGMSKRTIYQYFADKDELVYAFMQVGMQEQMKEMRETAEKSENVIEELHLAMVKTRELFSKVNPMMLFELRKYHPKAWDFFNQCKEGEMQEHLIKTMQKGIREGVFRANIDVEILAKMRLELVQVALDPKTFPSPQFNFVEVNLQLFEHFVYGIITLKGLNLLNQYKKQNNEANITS
jgi:TetR/AcrR family transcriptional regulator, cholesterol catabolism regulator